jgi:thymidylate kinase
LPSNGSLFIEGSTKMSPGNQLVVLLGPDGSGKSTIADMLVERLQAEGRTARHYPHRFGILPALSSFLFRFSASAREDRSELSNFKPIYDLKENSRLRSFIYVCWYGLDYLIGGIFMKVGPFFGRKKTVAIFARYFYDYYYQSNNRKLPDVIKKIVENIVPTPSAIFFLDRDPEEIHAGKPELPVEEILWQQQKIQMVMSRYPQYQVIDARKGAAQTVEVIYQILKKQWA